MTGGTEQRLQRATAAGRLLLLLGFLALLAGCGFQPRGQLPAPPSDLQPLRVVGLADYHPFMRELRRQLERAGVHLAEKEDEAAALLRIVQLRRRGRVFSVNARNSAVEYEYHYLLAFRVERPPGTALSEGTLEARRIVYAPGGELLGRVREGELREQDVHADLATRLLRRLSAL